MTTERVETVETDVQVAPMPSGLQAVEVGYPIPGGAVALERAERRAIGGPDVEGAEVAGGRGSQGERMPGDVVFAFHAVEAHRGIGVKLEVSVEQAPAHGQSGLQASVVSVGLERPHQRPSAVVLHEIWHVEVGFAEILPVGRDDQGSVGEPVV